MHTHRDHPSPVRGSVCAPGSARLPGAATPRCRTLAARFLAGPTLAAVTAFTLAACGPGPAPAAACPDTAAAPVGRAWEAYRAQDYRRGAREAGRAAALCPSDPGALTVLGYNEMQRGRLERAARRFDAVLARDSAVVDALIGRGLVAWRASDLAVAKRVFDRVVAVEPGNATALDYLARIPEGYGTVERPPLVLPDTVVYPARAVAGRFEVRTASGWRPYYVNGMNLGAALPGKHPSEFPDSATYAGWIEAMAGMNVNAIRVYTIHPPAFYDALLDHNLAHPDRPIRLIHGVWTELPPKNDFSDPTWMAEFTAEMHRVVDVLHGRADIAPRPGHASGHYTSDVSRWTLAYIIGREWEPFAVEEYDRKRAADTSYTGTYFTVSRGTPTDVWMARALEAMVTYEMDTYRAQRPVAYTNWPTLDPLTHPTETSVDEEVAIREALGEKVKVRPVEYDNDAVALDATLLHPTPRLPAGYFASFHAYPYYPDFMTMEAGYAAARSPWGASAYYGYLRDLKRHHGDLPVLIAEYGVPASQGSAHMQTQGWHHGGHTEADMARIDARMAREIKAAGMAGGAIFAWIDEWFKKNWLVIEFELPAERNRLWLNRLDPEQMYGMLAMEPEPRLAGATLADRLEAWRAVPPLFDADGTRVRVTSDEADLWILVEGAGARAGDGTLVGFDVVDPAAGEMRWPDEAAGAAPVALEFALATGDWGVHLVADDGYAPWRIVPVGGSMVTGSVPPRTITDPLPGFFWGRYEQRRNRPYQPVADDDGSWWAIQVITNRRRFTSDSLEVAAYGYDRGALVRGEPPDGAWSRLPEAGVFEVRIPWGLLNVTDPSQRRVLYEEPGFLGRLPDTFGTRTVDGIRLAVAVRSGRDGEWRPVAATGGGDAALYAWDTWNAPRWRSRRRPVYDTLRQVFSELETGSVTP